MKNKLFLMGPFLLIGLTTFAQNTFPSTGNVGIGTNAPNNLVEVVSSDWSNLFSINGVTGRVLIGGLGGSNGLDIDLDGGTSIFKSTYMTIVGDAETSHTGAKLNIDAIAGNSYFTNTRVGIGTTNPLGTLHVAGAFSNGVFYDSNDRPGLGITGKYPQAMLMAGGDGNANHGATVTLGSYDSGTSGASKHWSIGSSGQNSTFLDIGYSGSDLNPHAGIRNYSGTTVMTLLNSGYTGIGTLVPIAKLHIEGSSDLSAKLLVRGASGINPTLELGSAESGGGTETGEGFVLKYINDIGETRFNNLYTVSTNAFRFQTAGTDRLTIQNSGNIGIGTSTPDEKLTVAGKVHSREVKVTVDAGADYVFKKDYALPSLKEVETYITQNQHLPEIASAAEMKEKGIELGDMNIKLLKKIEELTLYILQQEKRIQALESKK